EAGATTAPDHSARRAPMPARASAAPNGSWRSEPDLLHYLRELQERAAAIETDLGDLQRLLPYQLLFDRQRVTGLTRSRLDSVIGAATDLWHGFNVLHEVLADADRLVGNGYRPGLDELRNVEWLLFEDSLDVAGRRLTPDEL